MDVNGLGMTKVRPDGLRSSTRNKGRGCELSNVSCGSAGSSFQATPTSHDRVDINFLTSGVTMRLQLRVLYPEK